MNKISIFFYEEGDIFFMSDSDSDPDDSNDFLIIINDENITELRDILLWMIKHLKQEKN